MFDQNKCVELRVLGPEGKPFVDLENKYIALFEEQGMSFMVPMLFSSPKKTTVAVQIGAAVIGGASLYIIEKLIDEVFDLQSDKPNIEININIQSNDKYFFIEGNKPEIKQKIKEFKSDYSA
jgi:hypothetical protein